MLKSLYGTLAKRELNEFVNKGTFASYICNCLGRELNDTLESLEEEDDGIWGVFPVADLHDLLSSGWTLDHEWFQWTDDIYRDDNNVEIPDSVPRTYTQSEQMAAYGLYLLSDHIGCMGALPDDGYNDQGWTRDGILEHEAACLIMANQAITYAHLLMASPQKTPDERISEAMSALGRLGSDAAHIENRAMKETVFQWCDVNMENFHSMDSAAEAVAGKVVPIKFRTARAWIGIWRKKHPSTGTL
jgi:hypothetical protein